MAEQQGASAPPAGPATPDAVSFGAQLRTMLVAFNGSTLRRIILMMALAALSVIVATSLMQIVLNRWNKPFYDAIERKDVPAFFYQLELFVLIAGVLLMLGIVQTWLNLRIRLRLREALTIDLVDEWLKPKRAFRLAKAGAIGVNPDQRMQEDVGKFTDLTTGLCFGFVQSSILLVSFVGVLWSLSAGFTFQWQGQPISIPGYMVWAVFLYAGSASIVTWLIGRPLILLNSDRYAREADLRHSMMHINEHIDAVALVAGEAQEKRRLRSDLADLVEAIKRIYRVQIRLEWATDAYGWMTLVAPILVASPIYFSGDMSFGGLMMAIGAFNQVHSSLRWFINNIGAIADWRATLLRVAAFRLALQRADELHDEHERIVVEENADKRLTFDKLSVSSPTGCTGLEEPKVVVKPGERVLITGDPAAGKTLFFRALAQLWPWGGGRVGLPRDEKITFIPRTPYFAPGTLRQALTGSSEAAFSDADLRRALRMVGLDRLQDALDREERWDRELNEEEQRLLAFASASLHRPNWVIIDEALDTLDVTVRKKVLAMIDDQLKDAAIVNIGRRLASTNFFDRDVHLTKDIAGKTLRPVDFTARAAPKRKRRYLRAAA